MKTVQKYIPSTAMLLVETTATEDVYIALSDYSALAKLTGEMAEELVEENIVNDIEDVLCLKCMANAPKGEKINHPDCIVGRAEAYKEGV
jgi:hypothetical protein